MRRIFLFGMLLVLSFAALVKAQQPIAVTLFVNNDSLTLYLSGNQPVSLEGLGFEVARNGGIETYYLSDFPAFQMRFTAVVTPICFRLERFGSQQPSPLQCQPITRLTQVLAQEDLFWFDPNTNATRTITVIRGTETRQICGAGNTICVIDNVLSLYSPLPVPFPTPTRTPPVSIMSDLSEEVELARNFKGLHNTDWIPIIGFINDIEMVLVPVGCFQMGSTTEELEALNIEWSRLERELPQHEQCIHEPFWIGRNEITNSEYAQFIAAGGYSNSSYWTTTGWEWVIANEITHPHYWNDTRWNSAEYPVVGISWNEAYAYSKWIGMRLPTEKEWEYTARGVEAWIFPWGNFFDGLRLNFCDLNCDSDYRDAQVNDGYRYTSPVGTYINGESWVGALDLSGNVWEWVSTQYDSYPYDPTDGRENMERVSNHVLRGGAWANTQSFQRSAIRSRETTIYRDYGFGFRVTYVNDI